MGEDDAEEAAFAEIAHALAATAMSSGTYNDPLSYREAMSRTDAQVWREAIDTELNALNDMGTFTLCNLPPGRKAIMLRFVFRIKRHVDGCIERYKARLVAWALLKSSILISTKPLHLWSNLPLSEFSVPSQSV